MPYLYFFDEDHIGEWLDRSQTPEGTAAYFEKYVYGVENFDEYLELAGGIHQLNYLKQVEQLRTPMHAPWLKGKSARISRQCLPAWCDHRAKVKGVAESDRCFATPA
jgi:hypothetical protein